ncbi:hypothetical protein TrVE_jg9923 [Triparma verrucosa]|uniref:peptidylprolyl isomerase n=1 Tax=Triparma verrucosa TaxID=1606542 RepID=A0A9W7CEE3_9STRA|nr:hypothetical protein TrVE_jg9923 [Triparma verrucosa]
MSSLVINTVLGSIKLTLRPDAAPITAAHVSTLVNSGLFNSGAIKFYRSDFVIQTGLYSTSIENPIPDLSVNETGLHVKLSNVRGTCSIAHHDVPDNGNSEFFINLGANTHLDSAYGGYCVFGNVDENDTASFKAIDAIAAQIAGGGEQVQVTGMAIL